jgi:hypothetical protein
MIQILVQYLSKNGQLSLPNIGTLKWSKQDSFLENIKFIDLDQLKNNFQQTIADILHYFCINLITLNYYLTPIHLNINPKVLHF